MKKLLRLLGLFFGACILSSALPAGEAPFAQNTAEGAWQLRQGDQEYALIAADGYCMVAHFDKTNKKFISSFGGPCKIKNGRLTIDVQFNTADKLLVGKQQDFVWVVKGNKVTTTLSGVSAKWERTDTGGENLAGNWRITQRRQDDGKMSDIPLRPRRTLKLLTAERFQWAAINTETGDFFGTGGGVYTFKDGKYTEHIEFFSRDSSRVGATLTFDAKIENGNWIHAGLSSKGDPIYEVWSRMK